MMLVSMTNAIFRASGGRGVGWLVFLAYFVVLAGPMVVIYRRVLVQRVRGFGGRNWPTVIATIDDFTIDETDIQGRGRTVAVYEVTLQYVFHNPEIQVGEYRREFEDKEDAEAWANSFKVCT
ncbi:MAG: hypothetical protein WA414_16930, partial [Acidobacteriaceae bacterium]